MSSYKPAESNFFVISEDLLHLLYWLMEHEQEELKHMVKQAIDQGCLEQNVTTKMASLNRPSSEKINEHMISFLMLLDNLLNESLIEHSTMHQVHRALIPSIDTIDRSYHQDHALARSIAKAKAVTETRSQQSPKDILCKELLKQWHPHKPTVN